MPTVAGTSAQGAAGQSLGGWVARLHWVRGPRALPCPCQHGAPPMPAPHPEALCGETDLPLPWLLRILNLQERTHPTSREGALDCSPGACPPPSKLWAPPPGTARPLPTQLLPDPLPMAPQTGWGGSLGEQLAGSNYLLLTGLCKARARQAGTEPGPVSPRRGGGSTWRSGAVEARVDHHRGARLCQLPMRRKPEGQVVLPPTKLLTPP